MGRLGFLQATAHDKEANPGQILQEKPELPESLPGKGAPPPLHRSEAMEELE